MRTIEHGQIRVGEELYIWAGIIAPEHLAEYDEYIPADAGPRCDGTLMILAERDPRQRDPRDPDCMDVEVDCPGCPDCKGRPF